MQIINSEVHLWHCKQADFSLQELKRQCLPWLTDAERLRFQRFYFDRHRKQLLLGRFLIRSVLSQYLKEFAPPQWRFVQNDHGKPALDPAQNARGLYFNLSHSGDRLVLAISKLETIGVDIESSDKPRRVARIAQRFFSRQEVADLLVLNESRRLHRFYQLWTLKEAYIKACGLGLAIPLRQFSYAFPTAGQIDITFDKSRQDDATRWQVWQFDVPGNYQLSLAVKSDSGDQVCSISSWNLPDLQQFHSLDTCISRSN